MSLMEQITNELKDAMKSGDKFRLSVYRMLKSSLQLEAINKKSDLSDEEVMSVIKKQVKVRTCSMEEYEKLNRMDLRDGLKNEIEILSKFLPEELSEDEIMKEIEKSFEEIKPESIKDMGKVMKYLTDEIGAKADMSKVSSIVKSKLI